MACYNNILLLFLGSFWDEEKAFGYIRCFPSAGSHAGKRLMLTSKLIKSHTSASILYVWALRLKLSMRVPGNIIFGGGGNPGSMQQDIMNVLGISNKVVNEAMCFCLNEREPSKTLYKKIYPYMLHGMKGGISCRNWTAVSQNVSLLCRIYEYWNIESYRSYSFL